MKSINWVFRAFFLIFLFTSVALAQSPSQKAWQVLETGMKGSNASERATAVRVLGLIPNDPRAVEMAEKALGDKEAPVRPSADKAWTILEGGVADKSADKRAKALSALGALWEDKRAEQLAGKALADEKPEVRAAAARALGEMGARSSASLLKEALKDKEAVVVLAATDALFRLQDEIAFSVYYAVLMGEKKTGESLMDSQMKMLKDPKALASVGIAFVPYAGAGMAVLKLATKDDTSPLRAAAALKLSKDPDPKSGQALAQSAKDPKWIVRAAVMDAIAKRGDASLLDAVVPLLDDDNETVRFNAAATVVRLTAIKGQ